MSLKMKCGAFCSNLWRKKTVVTATLQDTKLSRCLSLVDLIGLGLGTSLGIGVYVITSYAIKNEAGPAFVISVIIAGVAALFSGLCYAEFSARLPRAGSAYLYSYVTLGELCGFVVGWNMLLETVLAAALAAKAWSQYLDFMLNGVVQRALTDTLGWTGGTILSDYPDLLACGILLLSMIGVCSGAKISSTITLALVFFNVLIIMCFVCVGYFHVKHENWTQPPGFFSHGVSGVLSGAASIFFTFASFEIISGASEEAREPSKNVPAAIMITAFTTSAVYFCTSTSMTLSLACDKLTSTLALPALLKSLNITGASAVISVGALFGLSASCIGALYYIPRQLYAISSDRLLFKVFSRTSDRTKVPIHSAIIAGTVSTCFALILRLDVLIQMSSIGVLLAYSVVAINTICLRYQDGIVGLYQEYEDPDDVSFVQCTDFTYSELSLPLDASKGSNPHPVVTKLRRNDDYLAFEHSKLYHERRQPSNGYVGQIRSSSERNVSFDNNAKMDDSIIQQSKPLKPKGSTYKRMGSVVSSTSAGSVSGLFRLPSDVIIDPNQNTWRTAAAGLVLFIVCSILLCITLRLVDHVTNLSSWWIMGIVFAYSALLIIATVLIAKQPQNRTKLFFRTPYVPFVPLLSILINIFLIASLPALCWIRFIAWMAFGICVYFFYGYHRSLERDYDEQEVVLYEITDHASNSGTPDGNTHACVS